eukprot:NODE_31406_length_397_cov_3.611111.p5 GENE.NODE_31406_length_397_cov_3.611111~~NODE_31406_length_397_cov_3.611111.p5  ORF type:complete len:52 (-),score=29.46 NODE_31406_length_397_cov_3.611111:70-225(-)
MRHLDPETGLQLHVDFRSHGDEDSREPMQAQPVWATMQQKKKKKKKKKNSA